MCTIDSARALEERALSIRIKVLGPDHPDVAQSLRALANLRDEEGDYEAAKLLYRRALDLHSALRGRHLLIAEHTF
ncbi:MAG: tetratricopeptide repeat protein [Planctomycetes bacterium]|nr:tetratricopeptide repeat protein [Planctomycetota bacterium]